MVLTSSKTYSHEILPGQRIVVMTFGADYDIRADAWESSAAGLGVLNSLSSPIFYIVDLSALAHIDVEMLMHGAEQAAMKPGSVYRHPIIREILFVSAEMHGLIRLAAEGLYSETFGYIRARAFATVDEALAYARANA